MTAAPVSDLLLDDRTRLMPLTVEAYHALLKGGQIVEGAPYELLNGQIVHKDRSATGEDPMTVGNRHALAVMLWQELAPRFLPLGCHLRVQQPVTFPEHDEPEPDVSVVRGGVRDFGGRHPGAADVLCLVEVADSSRRRDRTTKLAIYAGHGVPMYVIIDLVRGVAEVYTRPNTDTARFDAPEILAPEQELAIPTASDLPLRVRIADLLP